jgi:hypothetical protein
VNVGKAQAAITVVLRAVGRRSIGFRMVRVHAGNAVPILVLAYVGASVGSARELLDSRIRTLYVLGIRFSITESNS